MSSRLAAFRESRSWALDLALCLLGLAIFGWAAVAALSHDPQSLIRWAACVPLIVLIARFPIVLDRGNGGIEIGFDSSMLIFLLCLLDPAEALLLWGAGTVAAQVTADKGAVAKLFNIGVGNIAGAAAAIAFYLVRGPETGTPRELLAVLVGAACYFATDYVLSALSVALDQGMPLGKYFTQNGTPLALACFVPFDLLGYLGAVVLRSSPWWTLSLLVIPVVTMLIATRAVTRASENARRLTVLLGAAVRFQAAYEPSQVYEALLDEARLLLRIKDVEIRSSGPGPDEIGARVHGKEATWIVAPARQRARSTTAADQQGLEALAALFSDALGRIQLTDDMVHFARHDPLTDLPNRGILLDRVTRALEASRRTETRLALLYIDLDGFKPVNDRFGHAVGDNVLVDVSRQLRLCVRDQDTVARLGGDEFAVLLEDIERSDAERVSERILTHLSEGVEAAGHLMRMHASIGIAYGDGLDSGERMLRHADMAMYEAKARGKAQFVIYEPRIGRNRLERLEMAEQLRAAVANGQLDVVYQPMVEANSRRIVGVEVLARWRNGDVDVSPNVFIPLAEETGLVVPLGELVLAKAVADYAQLRAASAGPIKLSVNVSASQLREPAFVISVRRAVRTMGSNDLVLELTEREGIGQDPVVLAAMHTISEMDVDFAIDDFGVGFSSISYLQNLPVRILKVDSTLSRYVDSDERGRTLLRSVALMAESLGLDVVVEGVERETQLDVVCEIVGAPFAQGFFLYRPMPLAAAVEAIAADRAGTAPILLRTTSPAAPGDAVTTGS
jgi:diguanylate cyclase (GGDEF)-like protein